MRARVLVWLGLASIAAGCAHSEMACPKLMGPLWTRYQSAHFVVTTDLPPPRARRMVANFESTYVTFLEVTGWHFPGRGEPPGRMDVIVFSRRADYAAMAPPHTDGFFRPESIAVDSAVIIDNDGTQPPGRVFLHELTHRLIRYYVPGMPLALNEGFAEYFSTFTVRGGFAYLGAPPERLSLATPYTQIPGLDRLLAVETIDHDDRAGTFGFYVAGWLLVHTLAAYFPQQLSDVLATMSKGDSFEHAWELALGEDGWQQLQRRYDYSVLMLVRQLSPPSVVSWKKPYRPIAVVAPIERETVVDDAALHLMWAGLQLASRRDASPQIALAAAHGGESADLSFLRALIHLTHDELDAAARDLGLAIAVKPEEERYRLALAQVHIQQLAATAPQNPTLAADIEWLAKNARRSDSLAVVGLHYAAQNNVPAAREQIARALAIDPSNPIAYLAQAIANAQAGDLPGAISAAERSLRLTPEGANTQPIEAVLLKLRLMSGAIKPLQLKAPQLRPKQLIPAR